MSCAAVPNGDAAPGHSGDTVCRQHVALEGASGAGAVLGGHGELWPCQPEDTGMDLVPARQRWERAGSCSVLPFEHLAWKCCGKEARDQP